MANQKSRLQKIRWTALILLGVGIAVLAFLQRRDGASAPLPMIGSVPEFSLTAQDGRAVARDQLRGSLSVVSFIFTRCGGTCPAMVYQMKRLQDATVKYPDIRLVSFSVDPEHDTPEVLQEYARNVGARPDRWMFVTGEKSVIYSLARKGFHLGLEEDNASDEEPITHSSMFVLVDRDLKIRGYYNGIDPESVDRLLRDMVRLARGG